MVGVAVLCLTVAEQTGQLGAHHFVTIAMLGMFGAVFCLAVFVGRRARTALVGLVLSLLPVAQMVLYVAFIDG